MSKKLIVITVITILFIFSNITLAQSGKAVISRDNKDPESDKILTIDLSFHKHRKNVGGSDGAGLCVFASMTHAAYWQKIPSLEIAFDDMKRYPGGGWPEKVDRVINRLSPGFKDYIQAEGDQYSIPLIDWAMSTGRMVCTTYGYSERYGGRVAHMVNLVYLDKADSPNPRAAILDNNFPQTYEWMSRNEYLRRARLGGGIWVYTFLETPPPPIPYNISLKEKKENKMTPLMASLLLTLPLGQWVSSNCNNQLSNNQLLPTTIEITLNGSDESTPIYFNDYKTNSKGLKRIFTTPPISTKDEHNYTIKLDNNDNNSKIITVRGGQTVKINLGNNNNNNNNYREPVTQNFGLDRTKMHDKDRLIMGGMDITDRINSFFSNDRTIPPNDAHKPYIVVVGSNQFHGEVKNALNSSSFKDKFLLGCYNENDFHVKEVNYPPGITITGPRDNKGRAQAYHYQSTLQSGNFLKALERIADPNFQPSKIPDLSKPGPSPGPSPVPIDGNTLLIIGGIILALILMKGKN